MDVLDDDDLGAPSEKRARLEGELGTPGGDDDPGGRGRSGRMRKKSAKVLEMEEFEETERKQATQGKTKGSAVKKKLVKTPPAAPVALSEVEVEVEVPGLPVTVAMEDSNEDLMGESSFKMKLPFTPTGMAAGPPVNLPPPPPSSKSLAKKPVPKIKKEKVPMPAAMSPPLPPSTGLESMLRGSPSKDKNLFETFSLGTGLGGDEVSALQMALQAELSPPPLASTEEVVSQIPSAEKPPGKSGGLSSPTHAPHLAAALLQAPISTSSLMLSAAAASSGGTVSSQGDESSDVESDVPLIIDTHRLGSAKKKVKKEKEKKPVKVKVEQVLQPVLEDPDIDRGDDSSASSAGSEAGDLDEAPVYSNTEKMALKLMTQAEKKASKKKTKKAKKGEDPEKPKKKRAPTAYMLWCNSYRGKVVSENPGIDFAQISKRLGEIWQSLPEKEKMMWKRKAKKAAGKGSTLISTGKAGAKGAAAAPKPQPTPAAAKPAESRSSGSKAAAKTVSFDEVLASSKQSGTGAVDVAAHLKLLGESLSIIGSRLQEHQGQIAVQGSLSVLLDSLLCALGPLMCLTQLVKELNASPPEVHTKTLDSIAYFMPGIG